MGGRCPPSLPQVRAEDGRCVTGTDISSFINNLPFGKARENNHAPLRLRQAGDHEKPRRTRLNCYPCAANRCGCRTRGRFPLRTPPAPPPRWVFPPAAQITRNQKVHRRRPTLLSPPRLLLSNPATIPVIFQAANIIEALEAGAAALLLDEDTCATNFMIRDARMQALVSGDKEPITPLTHRVRALAAAGVSVVLVMGGCGDYLEAADTVVMMDCFQPRDVTKEAHRVAAGAGAAHLGSAPRGLPVAPFPPRAPRAVPGSLASASGGGRGGGGRFDIKARA